MDLIKSNMSLESPENIRVFILKNYGINSKVKIMDGVPAIKVDNHISLATIVNKIRRDFTFMIFHQAGTDEYVIKLI